MMWLRAGHTGRQTRKAVLCLSLLVGATSPAQADEVIDRVLAVVAGDLIMLSDVRSALELGIVSPGLTPDPVRTALSTLIDRALMLNEVDRYAPPEPSAVELDRALGEVRARFESPGAFDRVLSRVGLGERQLRGTLRQNLRIRAYLAQRFVGDTPDRVRGAIEEWTAGLRKRAEVVDRYSGYAP